jgi:hypothetical protein
MISSRQVKLKVGIQRSEVNGVSTWSHIREIPGVFRDHTTSVKSRFASLHNDWLQSSWLALRLFPLHYTKGTRL